MEPVSPTKVLVNNAGSATVCADGNEYELPSSVKIQERSRECKRHPQRSGFKKKKKKFRQVRRQRPNAVRTQNCQEPVLLRPAGSQVPRAPKNSTQFIMDDHENSNLFYNFGSNCASDEENETRTNTTFTSFQVDDFEQAYRSAHEESLLTSDMDELKSAIMNLETRCAHLQHTIASRPSMLLERLQSLLIGLQEENKELVQENQLLQNTSHKPKNTSDSDSSSSSYSDSDSSDSECSISDCDQCKQKSEGGKHENVEDKLQSENKE